MSKEVKLDYALTSDSFRVWLNSRLNGYWQPQTYSLKVQAKEHDSGNLTLVSASYRHINGSIQEYHETGAGNEENSNVHAPFVNVSSDLLSQLDDVSSSDVTIKCGAEILRVHKSILAAKSPIFEAMFNDSKWESLGGILLINDFDPQVIRDLIVFIYSNEVQNLSISKACNLLSAAEKYQVLTLKDVCCDFLKPILINLDFRKELPYIANSTFIQQKIRNESLF